MALSANAHLNDSQRAQRRLLAQRLPLFAVAWFLTLGLWIAVYALQSRLDAIPAIVISA